MTDADTLATPTWRVEELLHDLGLLEDWLTHAGEETLTELADFAFRGCRRSLAELVDDLGWHAAALRTLLDGHTTHR